MSVKTKMQEWLNALTGLVTYANGVTGESDTNIGEAVRTLADGYGQCVIVNYFDGVNFNPGYISSTGTILPPEGREEVYSDFIQINPDNNVLYYHVNVANQTSWHGVAFYSGDSFISRTAFNNTNFLLKSDYRIIYGAISIPSNATKCSITFRSWGRNENRKLYMFNPAEF